MTRKEIMADIVTERAISIGSTKDPIDIKLPSPSSPNHLLTGLLEQQKNRSTPETVQELLARQPASLSDGAEQLLIRVPEPRAYQDQLHVGGSPPEDPNEEIELIRLPNGNWVLPIGPRAIQATSVTGGGSGDVGGIGRGRGGDSERGPTPPHRNTREYEASPERARDITVEIMYWEALKASGRYNKINWKKLDQAYLEERTHILALEDVLSDVTPSEDEEPDDPVMPDIQKVNPDRFQYADGTRFIAINDWWEAYRNGRITEADRERLVTETNVYFAEAKRVGLLNDLDAALSAFYYKEIREGINRKRRSDQVMPAIDQRIQIAVNTLKDIFNDRQWTDPAISRLAGVIDPRTGELTGVWSLYIQFARERFATALNNRDLEGVSQRPYSKDATGEVQEFQLGQTENNKNPETFWRMVDEVPETFWKASQGYYIEVFAETKAEFTTAVDTFITAQEEVYSSPSELLDRAREFIRVINNSEGAKKLNHTDPGFIRRLIFGMEARIGVFGEDQSIDLYNPEYSKQFLDFINKDGKGPDRWLELAKMMDGNIAATIWKLDKDPRYEILFSLFGARGQLADHSQVQRGREEHHGLFFQVYDQLVEEMLGVQIRNRDNVKRLTKFMPDRKFVKMFKGLYGYDPNNKTNYGDANVSTYNAVLARTPDGKLTSVQLRNRGIRLGKIQVELRDIRDKIRDDQIILEKDKTDVDYIKDKSDQRFYAQELAKTKKAVDIAFQMYGALGEKSKRAGGVFIVRRVDAEGKKFKDFVPIHYAKKFVQCAATLAKIQYANDDAKVRTAKVAEAQQRAIDELYDNGFEAKLRDAQKRIIKIKRLKEEPNALDELEEVEADFYTATHHIYAEWSGHTYWSYQEEDRHQLLSDKSFKQARLIRDGKLRPEDATMWAVQLLILDPTLSRVVRFPDNSEKRERKLTMAAIEDSYQTSYEGERELYRKFFPKSGDPTSEIDIYYGLQDYCGGRKNLEYMRAQIAEDPDRFSRRGRRLIPDLHNPITAASDYLGQGTVGLLGVIRMMDAPIYRGMGTFALDKFATMTEIAHKVLGSLVGYKDREGNLVEGLLLKLTNNSDKLRKFLNSIPSEVKGIIKWTQPVSQNEFCYGLIESLNREKIYLQLLTVMESVVRNAQGAFDLRKINILTNNRQLNPEFERMFDALPDINKKGWTRDQLADFVQGADDIARDKADEVNSFFNVKEIDEQASPDTGTGRHSARVFHDTFGKLLVDEESGGGDESYKGEALLYRRIFDKTIYFRPMGKGLLRYARKLVESDETIWKFIFGKFVPT